MVRKELFEFANVKSEEEYLKYFLNTLLLSNKTFEYFVDWEKVKRNLEPFRERIFLLNSLREVKDDVGGQLKKLLLKYPEVAEVLPLLVAEREKAIDVLDDKTLDTFLIDFSKTKVKDNINSILKFCKNTGIITLLQNTKDLFDYLKGVEVGLDTNSRKNRSGKIFEKIVKKVLEKKLVETGYLLKYQDKSIKIRRNKSADFVIYEAQKPILVIETSFYNTTGSKPIETGNAYIDLQRKLREKEISLIWVTDGKAWDGMRGSLREFIKQLDFIVNLKTFSETFDKLISII